MNDMHLSAALTHITQPLYKPTLTPRQIIERAYRDGMEFLAADGACCADLLQTWGEFSKYEVLTEGDSNAIFKSLDTALRDCTEANLIALGRAVRDQAMDIIAASHSRDDEWVQEEVNELRCMTQGDN